MHFSAIDPRWPTARHNVPNYGKRSCGDRFADLKSPQAQSWGAACRDSRRPWLVSVTKTCDKTRVSARCRRIERGRPTRSGLRPRVPWQLAALACPPPVRGARLRASCMYVAFQRGCGRTGRIIGPAPAWKAPRLFRRGMDSRSCCVADPPEERSSLPLLS
jgi:hypothetical protein